MVWLKVPLHSLEVLEKFDWETRRKESKRYVYDSGCMHCHGDIKNVSSQNMKSFYRTVIILPKI